MISSSDRAPSSARTGGVSSWPLLLGALCVVVLVAPWLVWRGIAWSEQKAYAQLAATGSSRLTLYGAALHSELDKTRNIPLVLAGDPQLIDFLVAAGGTGGSPRAEDIDRRLQGLSEALGISAIYLLDSHGTTLAASNWTEGAGSFVGQNFAFRPYFLAAMEGRDGRYFALGTTSNLPGYYIALPVRRGGRIVGAVVVKTTMDDLEHGWSGGGEKVFVTDRHGIVFLSNEPRWRFGSLAPLDPELRHRIGESRQYGDAPLAPLGLVVGTRLVSLDGQTYVMVSRPLVDGEGWTLHVLLDVAASHARARDLGLLVAAGLLLALLAAGFFLQRARMVRGYTRDLERRVDQRTVALVETNHRLEAEVVERGRAEEELKAKQEELVQATKLAALGQMSAGMAHEVNQPLAAIRSFADNAVTLLDLGRTEQVRDNLAEIAGLTERMARITGQLKQFARKSSGAAEPVAVGAVVEGALSLLAGRLRAEGVDVRWTSPSADLKVWGDEVRLQQVLINLFRNALDAMRKTPSRRLELALAVEAETIRLDVRDSGPGIPEDALPRLFEPFFTTKAAGEGMGLGLSISDGIVREFGGQLSAANAADGGAVFTLQLRRAGLS
ncbi:sensor histidine kinase [Telmatospirillum siberiense]|nr:ATP-binding protein [Telmatospirillum siberiense]